MSCNRVNLNVTLSFSQGILYTFILPKNAFHSVWSSSSSSCVPQNCVCSFGALNHMRCGFFQMFGTTFVPNNIIACSHSTHSLRYRRHRSTPVPPPIALRKKRGILIIRIHIQFSALISIYICMFTLLRLLLHQNVCCVCV